MVYINLSGTKEMFTGAYAKRVEQRNSRAMAEPQKTEQKRESFQDYKGEGATVTISEESKEFLEGVAERKAAQQAAMKAVQEEYSGNAFAGTGDFKQQYLVFSERLYDDVFYDNMSDDEVQKMEGMLKSITSGMDSINGSGLNVNHETEMSHEAAKLDLISSVNALNYFTEKFVPEEMRESFKTLINQYEEYNSAKVSVHKNIYDMRDESMKRISAPNAVNVSEMVKKTQEETKASMEIGKVSHTSEEEAKNKQDYQTLFDSLITRRSSANNIFDELKNTLIDYAAGGSKNANVLALLNARNTGSINNMLDYWSKLL